MSNKYNGYTNYETWNVCLWLGNDERLYRELKHIKRYVPYDLDHQGNVVVTKEGAEALCDILLPEGTPDISRREMKNVNWEEVAECINELI
jgi:hypothetical protein